MCTAFVKKGKDIITGFNFDMDTTSMVYRIVEEEDRIGLGLVLPEEVVSMLPPEAKVKNGVRLIQGVSHGFVGGDLCNMDFYKLKDPTKEGEMTIDLLVDSFVTDHDPYEKVKYILDHIKITNLPEENTSLSLHSLLVDPEGHILFVEPGNGYAEISENYFAVTNFSLLELPLDLCDEKAGYYGLDRYKTCVKTLKESDDDFSVKDALQLLSTVKQVGEFATRLSFVYSKNENTVYYCVEGDFENIKVHHFH